jgi:hypothetical protein
MNNLEQLINNLDYSLQLFVEQYDAWVWDNWPTAVTVEEINRELRELSEH